MKDQVNIYEIKAHLSRYLAMVRESGASFTICKNGTPIADLVPHREVKDPLKQDPELKGAKYKGDPCAPLDESDWPEDLL